MRQNGWLHSLALLASLEPMVLPKSTTRATIAPAARCSMSWVTHSGILQAAKPVDTSVTHELETWWNDGSDQKPPTGAWLRLETRGSSGLLTSCRRWTRAAEHEPVGIYDDDDDADDESAVATNSSNDALGQTMRLDVQPTPASPSEDEGSYDAPQTPDTGQNHSLPDAADAHAGFYGYDRRCHGFSFALWRPVLMQLDAASRGPQVVVPPSDNELPEQGSIPRLRYDFADECVRLWHVKLHRCTLTLGTRGQNHHCRSVVRSDSAGG